MEEFLLNASFIHTIFAYKLHPQLFLEVVYRASLQLNDYIM